jgi:hypothetical protein
MRGLGSKGWFGVVVDVVVGGGTVERRLEIAVSERASMNSFTMKSRLEKSSRVKLGPFGKTERGVDVVDALSSVMVAGWPRNGRGDVCAMRRR